MSVVTRIAPSPTGSLHIGSARTALFNYLFAKQNNGKFIVRLEDTDKKRSEKVFEKDILDGLRWLGLNSDRLVRQSERKSLYKKYIEELISKDMAYISREKGKEDGSKMVDVIRFRNKGGVVSFTDRLRGEIKTDVSDLGDFVIARSIDDPLYHLAVVIDDSDLGVTHVIRGDDHISNTGRQILLINAIGGNTPEYIHLPLIHSPQGGKLSKRKDAVSLLSFKEKGYLKDAMINFLSLLGFNPGGDREIYSLNELISIFSFEGLQKREAIFNENKLKWFNKHYLKSQNISYLFSFYDRLFRPSYVSHVIEDSLERFSTLKEIKEEIPNYHFLLNTPSIDVGSLKKSGDTKKHLEMVYKLLKGSRWDRESIKRSVWDYAEKEGRGEVLWPFRFSLSGLEKSPDPFFIAEAIGRRKTLARLRYSISLL